MEKKYMTVEEASKQWKISKRQINNMCEEGKIEGVAKLGEEWIVPVDAEKPKIEYPKPKVKDTGSDPKYEHGSDYKDMIWKMTQHAFPGFDVVTTTDKKGKSELKAYCSYSPESPYFLEEKVFHLVCSQFGIDNPKWIEEKMWEIHKEHMIDDEQSRKYYRYKFEEAGFTPEEVEQLMLKIEEHLQTRREAERRRWGKYLQKEKEE